MTIKVLTDAYIRTHGRKPRQPRGTRYSAWAIQIDDDPTPRYLNMTYKEAVKQAQMWAKCSITILP